MQNITDMNMEEDTNAYDPAFPTISPPSSPQHSQASKENCQNDSPSGSNQEERIPDINKSPAERSALHNVQTNNAHSGSLRASHMTCARIDPILDKSTFCNPTNKEYWKQLGAIKTKPKWKRNAQCLVCKKVFIYYSLKPHFLKEHIPWYMQLEYGQNSLGQCHRTRLKELACPLLTKCMQCKSLPVMCCVTLWGQLIHTFLVHLADGLGLKRPQGLCQFVVEDNQCHPLGSKYIKQAAVQCYIRVIKDSEKELRISPPSFVESILHWTTLMNIVSKLPKNYSQDLNSFEGFSLNNSEVVRKTNFPLSCVPNDIKARFVHQLNSPNLFAVENFLQLWPMLVDYEISGLSNASIIQYSLGKDMSGDMARLLFIYGASPDKTDANQLTPLHWAVIKGNKIAVQTLCEMGADLDTRTPSGLTSFDLAETKDPVIMQILAKAKLTEENDLNSERMPQEVTSKTNRQLSIAECAVCKEKFSKLHLEKHFLTDHVPWYICWQQHFFFRATEPNKSTWLKELLSPLLQKCMKMKTPPIMSCLTVWGQLIHSFFLHLARGLGLQHPQELSQFVVSDYKDMDKRDKKKRQFAVQCYTLFIKDCEKVPSVPPSLMDGLLHWTSLMNIISRLPKGYSSDLVSFEEFSLKKSLCVVSQKPAGLKMVIPPCTLSKIKKKRFVRLLNSGCIMAIDEFLEQLPSLVYQGIPGWDHASAIWYTLDNGVSAHGNVARLLFLHGASPDQLDINNLTPLHCAVRKGDVKAVKILCELGAQLDLKTPKGLTAFDMANTNTPVMMQILVEAKLKLDQNKSHCSNVTMPEGASDTLGAQLSGGNKTNSNIGIANDARVEMSVDIDKKKPSSERLFEAATSDIEKPHSGENQKHVTTMETETGTEQNMMMNKDNLHGPSEKEPLKSASDINGAQVSGRKMIKPTIMQIHKEAREKEDGNNNNQSVADSVPLVSTFENKESSGQSIEAVPSLQIPINATFRKKLNKICDNLSRGHVQYSTASDMDKKPLMSVGNKTTASKLNRSLLDTTRSSTKGTAVHTVSVSDTAQTVTGVSNSRLPTDCTLTKRCVSNAIQTIPIHDSTLKSVMNRERKYTQENNVEIYKWTIPIQPVFGAQGSKKIKTSNSFTECAQNKGKDTHNSQKLKVCETLKKIRHCKKDICKKDTAQSSSRIIPHQPVLSSQDPKVSVNFDPVVFSKKGPKKTCPRNIQTFNAQDGKALEKANAEKSISPEVDDGETRIKIIPLQPVFDLKDSLVKKKRRNVSSDCVSKFSQKKKRHKVNRCNIEECEDKCSDTSNRIGAGKPTKTYTLLSPHQPCCPEKEANNIFADITIYPEVVSTPSPKKRKCFLGIPAVTRHTVPTENLCTHPPRKRAKIIACAICGREDFQSFRIHALREHLPWYIGMQQMGKVDFQRTTLSQKIYPIVSGALAANSLPPGLPSLLWAQLCHGLLYFISYNLGLTGPFDLLAYIVKHNIPVVDYTEVASKAEETAMKTVHAMYLGEAYQQCSGPPSSLSQLLHPYILVNLISLLSEDTQKKCLCLETLADIDGTPIAHPRNISRY